MIGRRKGRSGRLVRLAAGGLLAVILAAGAAPAFAQEPKLPGTTPTPEALAPEALAPGAVAPTLTPGAPEAPAPTPAATAPAPLGPPEDPSAAKAYAVLDTHCARCHQAGRLKRPAPAGSFGNILRLDEIAADPVLVRPGNPDASRLYTLMLRRLMPFDVHQEQTGGAEPGPDDLQAVRAWISSLGPAKGCPDRRPVSADDIAAALVKAGQQASWDAGRQRFVSLVHLYNACHSLEALAAWREGVALLFNSLSWKPAAIRVLPVDENGLLLRIDLGDLGWLPAHWERIARSGGHAAGRLALVPAEVRQVFGTELPVVPADWLASAGLKAPLYYDLLGLPLIGTEIQKVLQIDADVTRRIGNGQRVAVKSSAFARGGRLVERYATQRGALWMTFDVVPRDGQRDPGDAASTTAVPGHDASLAHFSLPNGFPGFYVLNPRGELIDRVPLEIARRSSSGRSGVRAGLDCLGCHAGGAALPANDPKAAVGIFAHALSDRAGSRSALANAGLTASRTVDGIEPITSLARQYTRPLTLERAAAEFGVPVTALERLPPSAPMSTSTLVRRLTQGLVSRSDFETEMPALLAALQIAPAPAAGLAPAIVADETGDADMTVELLSEKPFYRPGDALNLTVKTSADCYLTLVSIDQRGRGTVIFPSDFEQNNFLSAGRTLRLPGESAPYIFRVRERGQEQVTAICSPSGGAVDGIKHDFERQRFTDLGDYATFLMQASASESLERSAQRATAQPAVDAKARAKRGAREPVAAAASVRPKSETVTRTGITIEVR